MLPTRVISGRLSGMIMALVLALSLVLIHGVDALVPALRPRANVQTPVSLNLPGRILLHGRTARWVPPEIIPRGTRLGADRIAELDALEVRHGELRPGSFAGLLFVYFLAGSLLFAYVRRFGPPRGALLRTQIGFMILVVGLSAVAKALLMFAPFPAFAIPVATLVIWAAVYMDRRTAFVFSPVMAFIGGSFVGFDPTLIGVLLASGAGAVLFLRDRRRPRTILLSGVLSGVSAAVMYLAMVSVFSGGFFATREIILVDRGLGLTGCLLGGVCSGVLALVFQGLAGRALGVVSRGRLLDLADLDNPVLRKMAAEAPGSWEHSRAMANLAEAASAAIGADALLTRVGAYYHDLGKTAQPKYFVENLGADERSPHEDLDPDVSADAIMVHVVQGVGILRAAGIPEPVVEFSYTHHGTSVIEYFWHKCKEQGNPKGLTEDAFRYPGMKPHSRETAILMLVDGIEAAARTIDEPSLEKFQEMTQRVVFSKLRQGQLDESGLTTEDLRVLATSLAQTLVSVYHHRIKYPWQRATGSERTSREPVVPAPRPEVTLNPVGRR